MRPLLVTALTVAPLLLCSLAAQAGRPLATEDAGVIEASQCEVESYAGWARRPGETRSTVQSLQLGCGVTEGTQLALVSTRQPREDNTRTLALAGKTELAELAQGPTLALAWGLGSQSVAGQGWPLEALAVNGVMSWPLNAGLTLHGNLGWSHSRQNRQSSTHWALALEQATTESLDLMGELFDDDRTRAPWLQGGLRWSAVPDRLWLDASYGIQTGATRSRALTLGLRIAF